jgi:CheY-like chemotaxis protein
LLIVDDDASVRETLSMVLSKANYVTSTAKDGVDALAQFRNRVPDLLLTDLEMPRMSAFDFLYSVRLGFPEVAVVAMSCISDEKHVPHEVISDAFYPKGRSRPEKLFRIVMDGIRTCEKRVNERNKVRTVLQMPRAGKEATGTHYVMVKCTECLRTFLVPQDDVNAREIQCIFCPTEMRFVAGAGASSLAAKSPDDNAKAVRSATDSFWDPKARSAGKGR